MMTTKRELQSLALLSGLALCAPLAQAQTATQTQTRKASPGFNLFSPEQDVEIGRQSAVEAERQLSLLNDRNVNRFLTGVISKLAPHAPGARYPYTIKAVNDSSINAFALPGGPMYVNRGLIEAARSESELAGVLAHEMAHVALRHGTHQVSKAYLAQSGLGILGGLLGKNGGNTSKVLSAVGGAGLNVAFLKFGRDAEYQADQLGAEMLAGAGYNPVAMADFFATLRAEQGRDPGRLEQFLSNHPSSADREARIRNQTANLQIGPSREVGGFENVRASLRRLPPAPGRGGARARQETPNQDPRYPENAQVDVRIEAPSSRFLRFEQREGLFAIEYPDNWRVYGSDAGYAVSMAPDGGVVDLGNGQTALVYGVIINHYEPFEGETDRRLGSSQRNYAPFEDNDSYVGSLEDATDDLVRSLIRTNTYLQADQGQVRRELIDGSPSYSVLLSGRSPITGQDERVTVVTRALPDGHVLYALSVVPGNSYDPMARAFPQMLRTLTVNDEAAHQATQNRRRNPARRPRQ